MYHKPVHIHSVNLAELCLAKDARLSCVLRRAGGTAKVRDYIQLAVDKAAADPEARTESLCDCSRKKGLPQDLIEMLTGYKQVACAPLQSPTPMHAGSPDSAALIMAPPWQSCHACVRAVGRATCHV